MYLYSLAIILFLIFILILLIKEGDLNTECEKNSQCSTCCFPCEHAGKHYDDKGNEIEEDNNGN